MIDDILGYSTSLVPAYGRIYKTSEEAFTAWKAGRDFRIVGGPYCSIRDMGKHINGPVYVLWNRVDVIRVE